MGAFFALIQKDLLIEFRQREAFATLLFLSVLLSVVAAFGVHNSFLDPSEVRKIFPALYWMIFVLTASVTIGKTAEYEQVFRAIDGVRLSGVSSVIVFLAKTVSNFALIFLGQLVTLAAFVVLSGVDIRAVLGAFAVVLVMVAWAYSSLVTLLSGITSSSRIKSLLLPLLSLPLLLPLFFAALELTGDLLAQGELDFDSFWLSLLLGLDVVYFVLGINLYEYVIGE